MAKQSSSNKTTSAKVAKTASEVLKSPDTGKSSKSAAGSALSQASSQKTTSSKAATSASKVLRDGRTSNSSKSAAGSALAQRPAKSNKGTSGTGPRKK